MKNISILASILAFGAFSITMLGCGDKEDDTSEEVEEQESEEVEEAEEEEESAEGEE